MFETLKAVLKAYVTAELVRSRGFIFGLMSMALWMTMFVAPMMLFASPTNANKASGYVFTAVLVFMSYSMATWDWAWELRWMLMNNMVEHVIISGRSIFIHYVGLIPVSFLWLGLSLTIVYGLLSVLIGPPQIAIRDPVAMMLGLALIFTVLFGHAMILGGTTISTGTSGPVMEFIGWILPIATGGLTPLSRLPVPLQLFAIATPYSYPAELLRYGLLGTPPLLDFKLEIAVGTTYGILFLTLSIMYFRKQLGKMLKEGPKTIGMY